LGSAYAYRSEAKGLRQQGMTQREIAEELGVSVGTANAACSGFSVITEKPEQVKRTWVQVTIRDSTDPATAAVRIREKLGEEVGQHGDNQHTGGVDKNENIKPSSQGGTAAAITGAGNRRAWREVWTRQGE
jgi:hypothetical protein